MSAPIEHLNQMEAVRLGELQSPAEVQIPAEAPVQSPIDSGLPPVVAPDNGRSLSEFAADLGHTIGPSNEWFIKSDRVVTIREKQISQNIRTVVFHYLDQHETRTAIEQYVKLVRVSGKGAEIQHTPTSISAQTAQALLASPQFKEPLPRIERILKTPLPLIHQGKLEFTQPGYDARFLTYCACEAPQIELGLEEAKSTIREIFEGFCLQDETARIMAVARFITPFCRGLMGFDSRPPIWIFEANRPRSGKDYLAGCTSILYEGFANEDVPLDKGSEETQKRIMSAVQSGRRFMHFANCRGHIDNAAFEQAATAKIISGRMLGRNDAGADLTTANEIEFSLSTNSGLTMTEDLNLRTRKISLQYFDEDANGRIYPKPKLHSWIDENRNRIIAALTKLVKHWDESGRLHGPTPFTSFPEWAEVVGGVMAACGLGDPCVAQSETELTGDENNKDMAALFELACEDSNGDWLTNPDLKQLISCQKDTDLFSWYDDQNRGHQTKLGKLLQSFKGRVLGGIKMEVNSSDRRRLKFRFTKVTACVSSGKESSSDRSECQPGEPPVRLTLRDKGVPLSIYIAPLIRAVEVPNVDEVDISDSLPGLPRFPIPEPEPAGNFVLAVTGGGN